MAEDNKKSKEFKFSQEQYEMLKRCSDKKDMTEWNEWRKNNPDEKIVLEEEKEDLENFHLVGANLQGASFVDSSLQGARLMGANLQGARLMGANLQGADLGGVDLQGADLNLADLQGAYLGDANLQGANLEAANLQRAFLEKANLQGAKFIIADLQRASLIFANLQGVDFEEANLQGTYLEKTNLQKAKFLGANLQGAYLKNANLQGANLEGANLKGTDLENAKLQNANFRKAIVDGETLVWRCSIDRDTKFSGVGLDAIRIPPGAKQLLKYNNRRRNWKGWYNGNSDKKWKQKLHQFLTFPVRLFWMMSDYGMSTKRIIGTFFALAFVFALAYWKWPAFIAFNGNAELENFQNFWHALYFSVVTMTTLGFGDIAANPYSWAGQGLLMIQVLLGYIMLGALVTRFAVLFTAGGPAGKFAKAEKNDQPRNKTNC